MNLKISHDFEHFFVTYKVFVVKVKVKVIVINDRYFWSIHWFDKLY